MRSNLSVQDLFNNNNNNIKKKNPFEFRPIAEPSFQFIPRNIAAPNSSIGTLNMKDITQKKKRRRKVTLNMFSLVLFFFFLKKFN